MTFDQPAKRDIDYAQSMLMHEARRKIDDEKNRIKSEAIKHRALQSNRVVVTVTDAAEKPATEITAWARPRLENLSNSVLGGNPPNVCPDDHQRIIRQYQVVFLQRVDRTLREVEIGYVRSAGSPTEAAMSDQDEWISAADALALLGMNRLSGPRTICQRAHGGMIKARADRFIRNVQAAESSGGLSRMWGDVRETDMTGRSVAGWGFVDGMGFAVGRNRD